jgi:hypothetical protein
LVKGKSSSSGETTAKKKFTLADMLKNARKVEREVGKPIVKALEDAGHIPNPFFDQIEESIMNKVDAFSRKLDGPFTREFGRKYHDIRQEAWKRAQKKEKDAPYGNIWTHIRGVNFALPAEAMLRDPQIGKTHYRQGGLHVNLVKPVLNWYANNAFESSRIYSGLETGNVSTSVELLEYQTKIDFDEGRLYNDELDELKMIYKAYWYLSGIDRRNWIRTVYSDPDTKVLDYRTSKMACPDGLRRHDEYVLFVVEGTDIYIQVEDLYRWITYYRTPGKRYAIGECDSELCVQYAIYLEYMYNVPEIYIQERLTVDLVQEVKSHMELLNLATSPLQKKEDVDEEDEEYAKRMLGIDTSFNFERAVRQAEVAQEAIYRFVPVDFTSGTIDLSQLDDGETDSNISEEDIIDIQEDQFPGVELPYDPNLHASNNEFEALFLGLERTDQEEIEFDAESVASEDAPDRELNPIDELGIDLIDPSRDTTDQPTLRRIGLAWDPGGGNRDMVRRFAKRLTNSS